jgi:photosystem II stability/assembly factor-like uncharacterized protein
MRSSVVALLSLSILTLPAKAQWDLQDSHTTASLRGIHSIGNGVAWASGTEGTILRTTDDGTTWQRCTTPLDADKLDFRGIQAFDQNTAIVMSSGKGDLSRLYKTTDACKSWKLVLTNPDPDGFWDAVTFALTKPYPLRDGWQMHLAGSLIGDPVDGRFVIYQSTDSGSTWDRWANNRSERPAHASGTESLFAASNSAATYTRLFGDLCFVTGGEGGSHLFVLTYHDLFDGGFMWYDFNSKRLPITSSKTSGAFSIAGRGDQGESRTYVLVGGDYQHPEQAGAAVALPATAKSGPFQRPTAAQTPPHGYRSAVAYDAATKTWITVGPNGTDISHDDGKNWTALKPTPQDTPDADKNWNALSLPFVIGPKGRIGKLRIDAIKP